MLTTARTAFLLIAFLVAALAFLASRPWIGLIACLVAFGFVLYLLMEVTGLD